MKPSRATPRRGLAASLLATTSLAALLLGGAPARAGGLSFDGQTQASVTNPANTTITSILFNNSTVTGAVTNAGTISPGKAGVGNGVTAALAVTNNSTIGGGIHNTGTISATGSGSSVFGILVSSGVFGTVNTIAGGISNTGTISASRSGLRIRTTTIVAGDITNSGMISGGSEGVQISGNNVSLTTITGRIVNTGTISGVSDTLDLFFTTVSGGVLNTGAISGNANAFAQGVAIFFGGVSGGFTNTGSISALVTGAGSFGTGVLFTGTTITGGVTNTGMISASGGASAIGLAVDDNRFNNVLVNGVISGGVTNSGTIAAASSGGRAIGVEIGRVLPSGTIFGGTISGGITNTGTISAIGKTGTGIALITGATVSGGITNTGTIAGKTAAIDLSGEGGPTVINQAGGALIGDVKLSANADVLNFTGGTIFNAITAPAGNQGVVAISGMAASFAPTASVSGVSAFTMAPGSRLTLQVTPTQAPSIHAGTIALAGTLNVAPQGSLFAFAASRTYRDVFVADATLSGRFTSVTTTAGSLFQASLSPDATTPNALDATLALSQAGLAASAQDLTQDGRLGLDAPRVLTQAVQDRLVANGGALGEWAPGGAASAAAKGAAGFSFGNANIWARGADQFGTATAPASSAGVGYDINRAAPLIAGVDWRFGNNIVAGVAATYVATSASFKDGSRTNVSSYQGAAYAGWAGGPWYALGSVVASFNDFGTSRLLTPFGLPGDATSSPSGQSYQGHAEGGYHWVLPAAGTTMSVTPYAALDYVNAHVSGFSETGGFGALSVNAADSNSFQTTLGVRLTSRIAIGSYGTLIPEVRLGWNHEFLDAAQVISASLFGVAGSAFSATGIAFGRDAALIGAGFSMELAPDAKVFVDYDGKLGQRLQEHSVSGGLKVRF